MEKITFEIDNCILDELVNDERSIDQILCALNEFEKRIPEIATGMSICLTNKGQKTFNR